jgi:hypothetical protein
MVQERLQKNVWQVLLCRLSMYHVAKNTIRRSINNKTEFADFFQNKNLKIKQNRKIGVFFKTTQIILSFHCR